MAAHSLPFHDETGPRPNPIVSLTVLVLHLQGVPSLALAGLFLTVGLLALPFTLIGAPGIVVLIGVLPMVLLFAALGAAAVRTAHSLGPGQLGAWAAALVLQAGFGTFHLFAAAVLHGSRWDYSAPYVFVFAAAAVVCWGTFALLLLPSAHPWRPARPQSPN